MNLEEYRRKLDEIDDKIVELMGDIPRIELFARQKVDGWDCWGDELDERGIEILNSKHEALAIDVSREDYYKELIKDVKD